MALLSGKTTDGRPAWNKYVLQNKNWKSLTLQIENKIKDVEFLVKKGNNYVSTLMLLSEGDKFSLESNKTFRYNSVEALNGAGYDDAAFYFEQVVDHLRDGGSLPKDKREAEKVLGL